MSKNSLDSVLQYLRRVALSGRAHASDAGLLDRFARQGDQSAFELLVALHGPMVLGVCRRLLRHEQDSEDAFQATFLTLARKAGTIANKETLACWLHRVACRAAYRVRAGAPPLTNRMAFALDRAGPEREAEVIRRDIRSVLDQEIAGLAERYHRPIVLCYLEGKTHEEAARLLGCPKGTVATRLARAREQLRRRLTRRGWTVSAGLLGTVLTEKALAVALPGVLARSTIQSVLAYTSGKAAEAGALSAKVLALSEGVLRMMWFNKMKLVVGVIVGLVLAGTGIGVIVRQTWADNGQGNLQQARNDPLPQNGRAAPNADAQDDSKAEIADLRKEIAGLRKEIKSLQDALRQTAAPQNLEPLYRGKPASFWLAKYNDADADYRAEAVAALGKLARKNKGLIPVVVTALSDENDVAASAKVALSQLGKEVVPILVQVLKDKTSPVAWGHAAWVLSGMGPEAKAAVPILAQTLLEEDWTMHKDSFRTLVKMGAAAKPAIPTLMDVLGSSLQVLRTEKEFEAWQLGHVSCLPPDAIFEALFRIDPEIRKLLPADFNKSLDFGSNGTRRYEDRVAQWQKGYEILKAKFQRDK